MGVYDEVETTGTITRQSATNYDYNFDSSGNMTLIIYHQTDTAISSFTINWAYLLNNGSSTTVPANISVNIHIDMKNPSANFVTDHTDTLSSGSSSGSLTSISIPANYYLGIRITASNSLFAPSSLGSIVRFTGITELSGFWNDYTITNIILNSSYGTRYVTYKIIMFYSTNIYCMGDTQTTDLIKIDGSGAKTTIVSSFGTGND